MTTYNLYHQPAHDLMAFRWNTKKNTVAQYSAAAIPQIIALHKKLFGYELQPVVHNGARGRYKLRHVVEGIV